MIEPRLERQRKILGEEDFRSGAERDPLVPVVLRIAVLAPLVDEDRHDGEPVVRLKEHLFRDKESGRAVQKRRRIVDRRAEVAGRSGSVLDGKRVIAAVPFQPLMAQPEGVAIRGGNDCARRRRATFRRREIEPSRPSPAGPFRS